MAEAQAGSMTSEERTVIFASSLGTVFEWYDFYLYGSLAAAIAKGEEIKQDVSTLVNPGILEQLKQST